MARTSPRRCTAIHEHSSQLLHRLRLAHVARQPAACGRYLSVHAGRISVLGSFGTAARAQHSLAAQGAQEGMAKAVWP